MIRAALAAGLLVLIAGAARAAPVSPADYAQQLDRVAQRLTELAPAGRAGAERAEQALSDLPARAEVGPLSVDNRELLRGLRDQVKSGSKGLRQAADTLRSLKQAVVRSPAPPAAGARGVLTEVLRRSEFQESWSEKMQRRVEAAVRRFLEWLGRHVPSLGRAPDWTWRAIGWGLVIVATGVIIYLVVRLTSGLLSSRPGPAPQELPVSEPIRSHREWLAEAERRVEAGEHREAVRALYLASLMKLDETGHVSYESFHTDGWFVRALQARGKGELARALAPLSRLFSAAWYGRAAVGLDECATARRLWQQLEALVS